MPAKPLTDHFPPADSRSGTAKPPAAAGSGGGAEAVLEAVAQQVLLHLAHGVARQLVHEEHLLRHLEVGERGLGGGLDGLGRHLGTAAGALHHREHRLAEVGVRHADDRRLLHARDRVDAELDLLRIGVEAAGDDEVLGPPDDMDVAALVDRRHVSGDEEAVLAELGGGLLRLAPRSEEHTSELQSLMRIPYAVFCLKKKRKSSIKHTTNTTE